MSLSRKIKIIICVRQRTFAETTHIAHARTHLQLVGMSLPFYIYLFIFVVGIEKQKRPAAPAANTILGMETVNCSLNVDGRNRFGVDAVQMRACASTMGRPQNIPK